MGDALIRRHILGSLTLAGLLGAALLVHSTTAHSQLYGALQYPPASVGADAHPPPPAGMVPPAASPRQSQPGISGAGEWLPRYPPHSRRLHVVSGEC